MYATVYPSLYTRIPTAEIVIQILAAGLAILCAYFISPLVLRRWIVDKDGNRIPPGPVLRYPFLQRYPERVLYPWAQKYGPLFSIWLGNQLFVVISDPLIARDLLVTNGAIFSSRKKYFMKNHIILRGRGITASDYGNKWRQHRRLANLALTPKALQGYVSVMDYESHVFIKSLYEMTGHGKLPINPAPLATRFALNNMLLISFSIRTSSASDPLIASTLDLGLEFMDLTGPWSNIVDFFVPLQWIPTKKRSRGLKLHDDMVNLYGSMVARVKDKLDAGEHVPDCLVKTILDNQETEKLDWKDLVFLSASFTLGGVHSTAGIIQWFLALIPSHPHIVERAYEELDRVVGRNRWPNADDESNLPYIRAIIKEVQRLHSPFWFGTPHCTSQDFTYNGQYIPKDTVVILNCYNLHHNESRYPNSYTFDPDRYMNDDLSCSESAKLPNALDRDHWAFGAGRRICPGLPAAERELWLAISRLLWSFKFEALPDEPISLEEYEGQSGRTPIPFRLKLIPRLDTLNKILQQVDETTLQL